MCEGRSSPALPCPRLAPVAIKRLKDQSPEQQVQFLKEMAILRACRGSRYVVNFVGASLLPVRLRAACPPRSAQLRRGAQLCILKQCARFHSSDLPSAL